MFVQNQIHALLPRYAPSDSGLGGAGYDRAVAGDGIAAYYREIIGWIEANQPDSAQMGAAMNQFGVTPEDIAAAYRFVYPDSNLTASEVSSSTGVPLSYPGDATIYTGSQSQLIVPENIASVTVAQKIDAYQRARGNGWTDAQIRAAVEQLTGPQSQSDWAYLVSKSGYGNPDYAAQIEFDAGQAAQEAAASARAAADEAARAAQAAQNAAAVRAAQSAVAADAARAQEATRSAQAAQAAQNARDAQAAHAARSAQAAADAARAAEIARVSAQAAQSAEAARLAKAAADAAAAAKVAADAARADTTATAPTTTVQGDIVKTIVLPPNLQNLTPAQKIALYRQARFDGFSDSEIRAAVEEKLGPQAATDWAYLQTQAGFPPTGAAAAGGGVGVLIAAAAAYFLLA